jgi:phage terminase small subunit
MKKLTKKQSVFVEEYLVDLNATQAAIRAGYSEKTAHVIGAKLVNKSLVADAIAVRMRDREARTQITQDKVLREISPIAFAGVTNGATNDEVRQNTVDLGFL